METIYRPRVEGQRYEPVRTAGQVASTVRRSSRTVASTFQRDPRWALWLTLWLPFWLGSAAPPPRMRWLRPQAAIIASDDPAATFLTTSIARMTRTYGRAWFCGSLLRGLAIGLLVLVIWAGIAAASSLALPTIPVAIGILVGGVALGGIHGWLIWPSQAQTLRMLDRTFELRERMVSAFERPTSASRVSRIQLADAANTLKEVSAEIPRSSWIPVREVVLGLILTGMLVTIMLAGVSSVRIAPLTDPSVPQFLLASERMAVREQPVQQPPTTDTPSGDQATIADIQQRGRESQQAREDLRKLAEALESYPITQPVADAIASEDYDSAADLLRTVSESTAQMEQAEREAMADDLDEAAAAMSEANPDLAQATRDSAAALREGGTEAESALNDLADEVESTGNNVESQEALAQELDDAMGTGSSSNQSSKGAEGEQGAQASGSGSEGESGSQAASDPGEGASANPGVVNQQQESQSSSSAGSEQGEGSTEEGAGSAASDEGAASQSSGSDGEAEGDGANAEQGGSGQQPSSSSTGAEGADASQGGGAGSGESQTSATSEESGSGGSEAAGEQSPNEEPGTGQAGDPPPGSGEQGADGGNESTSTGSSSLQLAGTSDESVQSGGESGTSSTGSGSDSTTTSGDLTANDPGEAGPDSNRVPPSLRDIVRDYFEGPLP